MMKNKKMSHTGILGNIFKQMNTFLAMTKRVIRGKVFYTTRAEAVEASRKGDRIYYVAGVGYYIVRRLCV